MHCHWAVELGCGPRAGLLVMGLPRHGVLLVDAGLVIGDVQRIDILLTALGDGFCDDLNLASIYASSGVFGGTDSAWARLVSVFASGAYMLMKG